MKLKVFFDKKPSILSKNTNFGRFEKSYYFSLLRQIYYILSRKLHVQKRKEILANIV